MERFRLEILGETLSFTSRATPERIEEARLFIIEQYNLMKAHEEQLGKEKLLLLLVLGVADNLLQSQRSMRIHEKRMNTLIEHIAGHLNASDEDLAVSGDDVEKSTR